MKKFRLGDEVWRVQGQLDTEKSIYVHGPAIVTAIIHRAKSRDTYFLTWKRDWASQIEVTDEQQAAVLYRTEAAAQREANRWHNSHLEVQKR
ncbi:MAG: hypothetical protein V3T08_09920 [Gemmatimonadota bacterium]